MNGKIEKVARELLSEFTEQIDLSEFAKEYLQKLFLEKAAWLLSHQWISVDEELPKCRDEKSGITDIVIAKSDLGYIFLAYYDYSNAHWYHNYEAIYDKEIYSKITHWMKILPLE